MSTDVEREGTGTGQDFIVSELISELKAQSERQSKTIRMLVKVVIGVVTGALLVALLITGGFLLYMNQYDFSEETTNTTTTTTTKTADGVYAIIDSEGNTVTSDLTPEQLQEMLEEGVVTIGESNGD